MFQIYLNINDKCNLKLVNKYFYKIESRAINFHLGTFISNYLGIDNKCDEELEILQIYRFEILDEISRDLKNFDLEFRIEELESKFSKDLSKTTFNEIRELKKQKNVN